MIKIVVPDNVDRNLAEFIFGFSGKDLATLNKKEKKLLFKHTKIVEYQLGDEGSYFVTEWVATFNTEEDKNKFILKWM